MAIAFDQNGHGTTASAGSLTFNSGNTSASASIGVVFIYQNNVGGSHPTAVSWDGVAMTHYVDTGGTGGSGIDSWYILVPHAGVKSIVVTLSSNDICIAAANTYTGTGSSIPNANNSTGPSATVTSISTSVTTITDNSWLVGAIRGTATVTAGANTTLRGTEDIQTGNHLVSLDTNAVQTPAGGHSVAGTMSSSTEEIFAMTICPPLAYTLTAAQGSYALTGQTTLLTSARRLTAAVGTYTLTGINVALSKVRSWSNTAKSTDTWTNTGKS